MSGFNDLPPVTIYTIHVLTSTVRCWEQQTKGQAFRQKPLGLAHGISLNRFPRMISTIYHRVQNVIIHDRTSMAIPDPLKQTCQKYGISNTCYYLIAGKRETYHTSLCKKDHVLLIILKMKYKELTKECKCNRMMIPKEISVHSIQKDINRLAKN